MSETTPPAVPRKRGWLPKLGIIVAVLVVLVAVAYFVLTSAWFVKSVVLPKAGAHFNSTITAADVSLHPFSSVTLKGFQLQPVGAEPLVQADEARVRYSLTRILGGNIDVAELILESPRVHLVKNADGTSNVDPLLRALKEKEQKAPKPTQPSQPPKIDIKKIELRNGRIEVAQNQKGGVKQITDLSGLTVIVTDLKNGQTAKLTVRSDVRYASTGAAAAGELTGHLDGDFAVTLTPDLMPNQLKGGAEFVTATATGAFADAAKMNSKLVADLTPTELKQFDIDFTRGNAGLGKITAAGPFDGAKLEGNVKGEVTGIGNEVLSLVGGRFGMGFGNTRLGARYQVELKDRARFINAAGSVAATQFSLTRSNLTTPALDWQLACRATVDLPKTTALIRELNFQATQDRRPLAEAKLSKEMLLDWSKGSQAADESSFQLTLTKLNLADWRAFLGPNLTAGVASGGLNANVQKAGRQIAFDFASQVAGAAGQFGTNKLEGANLTLTPPGVVADFAQVKLADATLRLHRANDEVASAKASGQFNATSRDADFQTQLGASVPGLMTLMPRPDVALSSGALQFTGRVTQKNLNPAETNNPPVEQAITGELRLTDLSGQASANRFDHFEAIGNVDIGLKDQVANIRKLNAVLKQAGQPGGSLDLAGTYDLAKTNGQFTAKLSDLNQDVVRSFAAASLGQNQLASIAVNANARIAYDPRAASTFAGDFSMTNLVVKDPAGTLPSTPLALDATLDTSMVKQVLDLKRLLVRLTPTDRARNEVQLAGKVDLSRSNAYTGNLMLTSDALDFTRYYELFANRGTPAAAQPESAPTQPAAPATPAPAATNAPAEPEPIVLPLQQFNLEANVGAVFVRDLVLSNVVAVTRIDGGRVAIDPFKLSLNGAPVTAKALLNLAVKGWEYDVAFNADRLPLEPIANTFEMGQRGQYKGFILAQANLKGAGITGTSLKKSLTGGGYFAVTNAHIQLFGEKPAKAKKGLLGGLFNVMTTVLKPVGDVLGIPDFTKSPLLLVDARANIGDGAVNLSRFFVDSPLFQVTSTGTISIADVLTNSTINSLPVNIALERSAAIKARLAPADTPTNETYVALPNFVQVAGTVTAPQVKRNDRVIAGLIGKSVIGIVPGVGGTAGSALQSLTGALTGQTGSTNQATNAPTGRGVLGGIFGGLLGQPAATNAPAPGTNRPATNPPPRRGLFDLLK